MLSDTTDALDGGVRVNRSVGYVGYRTEAGPRPDPSTAKGGSHRIGAGVRLCFDRLPVEVPLLVEQAPARPGENAGDDDRSRQERDQQGWKRGTVSTDDAASF
jgi:hypothetical protein